jgi:hypothetical protein
MEEKDGEKDWRSGDLCTRRKRHRWWCSGVEFQQPSGIIHVEEKGEKRGEQGGLIGGFGGFIAAREEWERLWGPRLTTRDSRYAYNSRSQEDRHEST